MVEIDHQRVATELLTSNVGVNMTHLARKFGKRPDTWLKTQESKDYIQDVAIALKSDLADLVKVRYGGIPGTNGTWCFDRTIAVRFAQWLSPKFSIAVDMVLVKLLLGDAVIAEPFNDIEPVIHNKKPWYYYRDVLHSLGFSTKSGTVSKRKKENPKEFTMLYNRNFITPGYCNQLHHEALNYGRHLQFSFSPAMSLQGGVI